MPFSLRTALQTDLVQVLSILNHEISTGMATWSDQEFSLPQFLNHFQQLQKNNHPFFVVVEDQSQRIAGYGYYSHFRTIAGFRHTVEHSLFIHPDFARQGLGKRLLHLLIQTAQQQQKHIMIAAIDHDNQASIALHQHFGFVQTAYMPQVGFKHGQWRDLILMQYQLPTLETTD